MEKKKLKKIEMLSYDLDDLVEDTKEQLEEQPEFKTNGMLRQFIDDWILACYFDPWEDDYPTDEQLDIIIDQIIEKL